MRKRIHVCVVMAAVAGAAAVWPVRAESGDSHASDSHSTTQPSDRTAQSDMDQGASSQVPAIRAAQIRSQLRQMTEITLNRDSLPQLSRHFADQQRNQLISSTAGLDYSDFNRAVDQIRTDWSDKYRREYGVGDQSAVYTAPAYRITPAVAAEEARQAGERDVPATQPGTAGNRVAVTVPASHGLAETTVYFVEQNPGDWRADVPGVEGQALRDNLTRHLTMIHDQRGNWPDDPNEANRLITHHILLAIAESGQGGQIRPQTPSER